MPEPQRKLSGSLFTLGECGEIDRKALERTLADSPKLAELVRSVFALCKEHPEMMTDITHVRADLGLSRSGLVKRVNALIDEGLMEAKKRTDPRGHRNVYVVLSPAEAELRKSAATIEPHEQNAALVPQVPALFPDLPEVEMPEKFIGKGERFLVFTLASALRLGRTGKNLQYRRVRLRLKRGWCDLEVRAAANSYIPSILDTRPLIAALTLVREYANNIEGGKSQDQGHVVRMADICCAMGLDPSPSNKNACFAQLARWRSSEFVIRAVMRNALDFASDLFEIDRYFSVIDDLTVEHVTDSGKTVNRVHIVFNPRIIKTFGHYWRYLTVHHEILRARQPKALWLMLYFWCRRVVRHEFREPMDIPIERLQKELHAESPLRRFKQQLGELIQENQVEGSPHTAKIPGYFISWAPREGKVAFCADPQDPVVGRNSLAEQRPKTPPEE